MTALTKMERFLLTEITKRKEAAGISVSELARRAGLPRETVSRVLSGKQRAGFGVWEKLDDATRAPTRKEA